MGKQGRVGADDPSEPHPCPLGPGPEPLVLVAAPADQVGVYPPQGAAESRPIEVAVVVDPALGVRIEHPCQILQEHIPEARAYHPTLRSSRRTRYDAAILHLYRSHQPALDVEARPRAIRMFTDRSQEQFPIDAVERRGDRLPIAGI